MQNRQAARYARWSAGIAVAICLLVIGVYVQRRVRSGVRDKNLHPVPASVAQQSAGFTLSRSVGQQKLFVVRASEATQFKDQNRGLLENVTIKIYGARGERDDSVRADECSYEPQTGSIRCHGVVQIDLRNAKTNSRGGMHLQTSDILFDRDSGKVSTEKPVALQFTGGRGQADGVLYDPQSEDVTLEKSVQLEITPSAKSRELAVNLSGSSLEFRRKENALRIFGPVRVQQSAATLTTGMLELQLDAAMRPAQAVATGNPEIHDSGAGENASFSAERMGAEFTPEGTLAKIIADQDVHGESIVERTRGDASSRFSSQHAELLMNSENGVSQPRELLADGNVQINMRQGEVKRSVATGSERMNFAPNATGRGHRIASAETLGPGEMITTDPEGSSRIRAGKLQATFGARSELTALRGCGGVQITRALPAKPPQSSTARAFAADFARGGIWQDIDEKGDVKFREGDRQGAANEVKVSRATNEMTLTGAASVQDPATRLQAAKIQINQASGDVHASGAVLASYFGKQSDRAATANSMAGAANISADEVDGSGLAKSQNANAHAVFSGHARMWQGGNVLQADTIELWQNEKRAEGRGHVIGEFVEAAHKSAAKTKGTEKAAPILWQVKAPQADYWGDGEKMEWSGGVRAHSSEASISSQTLELSFSPAPDDRQILQRAIATGGVRIEQNGRTGTAEHGEYVAREGKFVLSGGQPALADSSGNRTTGRELTFFLASDTILVESQNGSRAPNRRVEK
jgi:lipopolysaccharide export system protein LptA